MLAITATELSNAISKYMHAIPTTFECNQTNREIDVPYIIT